MTWLLSSQQSPKVWLAIPEGPLIAFGISRSLPASSTIRRQGIDADVVRNQGLFLDKCLPAFRTHYEIFHSLTSLFVLEAIGTLVLGFALWFLVSKRCE
jgi:hypothetical protein